MSLDRNKTQITHDVTAATTAWLDEKGFKPVETEVTVADGWCADLAGVIIPTQTELINLKLLNRPPSWNERFSTRLGVTRREWTSTRYAEWRSELNRLTRTMTALVEVKTSRGDFCGDRKWMLAVPTDLAYVAYPKGLIRAEEWPQGWGILEYSTAGVRCVRAPRVHQSSDGQQRDVVLNIGIRRDHHTRYERWREFQREQRLEDAQRKQLTRVGDIAKAVLRVARGERSSLEECLLWTGLRDLPEWVMEPLRDLYGCKPELPEPEAYRRTRQERHKHLAQLSGHTPSSVGLKLRTHDAGDAS